VNGREVVGGPEEKIMTQGAAWTITHKLSYDMGFVELPKNLQRQATQAQVELAQDPITPRGKRIKPLKGWENVYRYRLGGYRLIYSASEVRRVVRLLAIGPRSDVYERFNYEPEADQLEMVCFGSELAAELTPRQQLPPWVEHPERYGPREKREPLPRKLTPSQLGRWRVSDQYHEALIRCRTEDDLFEADIPAEVLGIVMEALWPSTVDQIAGQPDLRLFRPEDMERYAEGTLRGFLLHLDEQQRRFTNWALAGPTLVKGGPGSGKSTVALYRVRALVERALETTGEIPDMLFATYTNPLINFSRSLLIQLLGDLLPIKDDRLPRYIRVSTVDSTVMWIARDSGECPELVDEEAQLESLHVAQAALKPRAMGDMEKLQATMAVRALRDSYLLSEFEWVIEGQNCRKLDDYLAANRAGRGIPFNETVRRGVWQLYEHYREHLKGENLCTWGQLRQFALDRVRNGEFTRRWDHVIIDEAQDLTPAALALCVELARDPGGVFLTADANQSLYNRSFRWSRVHDDLQVNIRIRTSSYNELSSRPTVLAAEPEPEWVPSPGVPSFPEAPAPVAYEDVIPYSEESPAPVPAEETAPAPVESAGARDEEE
jgi:mRNA-degrading endonuclease RelE of RelBE toxin-antitoxin system